MTNASRLVSVVIPSYNHAHFLPRALKSVQAQTWTDWEIIVVDNHSNDNTDEVIRPWLSNKVRLLKIHNHGVIAASRNKGVCAARGEWIAFLDSDDWWSSDKLDCAMQHARNGADVVFHDLIMVDGNGKMRPWRRSRSRQISIPAYEDLIANGCALPNSSVLIRKASLERIGGLCEDSELIGWEDFDTWLRLARLGCNFERLGGSHGYYWVGGGNITNPRRTLANIDEFIFRYIGSELNTPWWCNYARAVAYYELGEKSKTDSYFVAAWQAQPRIIDRFRIAAKWLICR